MVVADSLLLHSRIVC